MTFADLIYTTIIPFIDGYVIQLLYAFAFISFIYGMFKFFFTGGEENRQKGKEFAVWGIVGLVVLFSVWSIVKIVLFSVFPYAGYGRDTGEGAPIGSLFSGANCSNGSQCRSGVCTKRGIYTSTCE